MAEAQQAVLEKLEFKPFGPYRFIGKAVCAAPYSGAVFGALWGTSPQIMAVLDNMPECCVPGEPHEAAYMDFQGIQDHSKLWYIVGKFMKPDAPVPEGFDFRDIPAMFVGVGYVKGTFDAMIGALHSMTEKAIMGQTEYAIRYPEHYFSAEIYLPETVTMGGGESRMRYYMGCERVGEG